MKRAVPAAPMFEEWMLNAAYDAAAMLPTEHNDALAVLALVKQIVLKINKPYVVRLRTPVLREALKSVLRGRGKSATAVASSVKRRPKTAKRA
jgi:hypothetical protein